MQLAFLDWVVIGGYLVLTIAIGLVLTKKASNSTEDYFLAGRALPWWIAGTSMVATSFATDAPLAATRLLREEGLSGFWFPLSWLFADLVTLYFFARLWRRAHVTTDVEITEVRYGNKPAAWLRAITGLYNALPMNCVIIGWVTLAMVKILSVTLGLPKEQVIPVLMGVTVLYSFMSGLWGVVVTDFIQFIIATVGAITLAVISVDKVGGIEVMNQKLATMKNFGVEGFNFFPDWGMPGMAMTYFVVVMAVQWWAQKNVAGGGQLTQRMFATKDEKHSILSVLWFTFLHYVIRPWPWMIVAMVSLILYPNLVDNEIAYPQMVVDLLPTGLKGLMIVSLLAAFMSTLDTHLNWGASYLTNDIYKRFVKTDASKKHYVWASKISMLLLAFIAGIVVFNMNSIVGAWKYLATMTAGVGPVYILRWYWHRINAWSEISALVTSGVVASSLMFIPAYSLEAAFPERLLITLALTTIVWLIVTFVTRSESDETLKGFYMRVKPHGLGWEKIRISLGEKKSEQKIIGDIFAFFNTSIFMISTFFFIGKFILQFYSEAFICIGVMSVTGFFLYRDMVQRVGSKKQEEINNEVTTLSHRSNA